MANKQNLVTEKFLAKEVNIMLFALRYLGFEKDPQTGIPHERLFSKQKELVAFNTHTELKKGLDEETRSSKDCDLAFGTEQKALLIECIDSIQRGLNDIEFKISVIEKLK